LAKKGYNFLLILAKTTCVVTKWSHEFAEDTGILPLSIGIDSQESHSLGVPIDSWRKGYGIG
jgi:hypothetical protein